MHINPTQPTVAEYCDRMERGEIVVNKDYQRSNQVWPPAAKSFLIETILLGFPMPKLALHQRTSTKTRKTVNEIIDGQQRSQAILEYYQDKFKLSGNLGLAEARGCIYSKLPEDLQGKFVSYGIPVDVFVAATEEEIQETFRRMNSYNVPLNNEEKRHARYQGPFKWFVNRLASKYSSMLVELGVLGERQVFRMADAKLITEVVVALERGIRTSSPKDLDKMYSDYDKVFTDEETIRQRVEDALEFVLALPEIHRGPLMKPFQFYSLLLAICHYQSACPKLEEMAPIQKKAAKRPDMIARLLLLSEVAEAGEDYTDDDEDEELEEVSEEIEDSDAEPDWAVDLSELRNFARASAEGTNTITTRAIRFRFFYDALMA